MVNIISGQPSNVVDVSRTAQFNAPVSQISFSNKTAAAASKDPSPSNRSLKATTPSKVDVDTFVPDDGDFDNFLDETDSARYKDKMMMKIMIMSLSGLTTSLESITMMMIRVMKKVTIPW